MNALGLISSAVQCSVNSAQAIVTITLRTAKIDRTVHPGSRGAKGCLPPKEPDEKSHRPRETCRELLHELDRDEVQGLSKRRSILG